MGIYGPSHGTYNLSLILRPRTQPLRGLGMKLAEPKLTAACNSLGIH